MSALTVAESLGKYIRKANGGYMACCPAHDDQAPSLSIDERDGKLLVKCFAGCSQQNVIAALRNRNISLDSEQVTPPTPRVSIDIDYYWSAATAATDGCQYLRDKRVRAHGLRWYRGAILVPMRNNAGNLVGILRIYPDGGKRTLSDSQTVGTYHLIGDIDGRVYLAEGYATAATIYEASGVTTVVCFACHNLLPVAVAIRAKYPDIEIVICADDDHYREGNPGLMAAEAAARAVNGLLAVPKFPHGQRWPSETDFNDLARVSGVAAVRCSLASAQAV